MPHDDGGRNIANDPAVKEIARLLSGAPPEEQPDDDDESGPADDGQQQEDAEESDAPASDDAATDDDSETDSSDDAEAVEGVTIKQIAEKLGVTAADIYNDLLIPMPHSEPITLGQFKDRVQELTKLDELREQHSDDVGEWQKTRMRDRALLNNMLQIIGPDRARPALAAAEQQLAAYQQEQQREVLIAIPEWNDKAALVRDTDQIVKLGAEYGFSESEMTYTQDARTVRMLRDFAKLRERNAKPDLAGKIQRVAPGKPGAGKVNRQRSALAKAVATAKASPNNAMKAKGVAALLDS